MMKKMTEGALRAAVGHCGGGVWPLGGRPRCRRPPPAFLAAGVALKDKFLLNRKILVTVHEH